MENLQAIFTAVMLLLIPWLVSTYAWPAIQRTVIVVRRWPSIAQQLGIVLVNYGLVIAGGFLGTALPGVEGFGAGDLQALMTAGVGFLSTLIFKAGKVSGVSGRLSP